MPHVDKKRSAAAKKAWETRRNRALKAKRSASAKKAAATRKKNQRKQQKQDGYPVLVVKTEPGTFSTETLIEAIGTTGSLLSATPLIVQGNQESWICKGSDQLAKKVASYKGVLSCKRPGEEEVKTTKATKEPPLQKESARVKSSQQSRKTGRSVVQVTREEMEAAQQRVAERESCREVYLSELLHVVEYPPQVRVCKFAMHGQNSQRYLAMPFMQFTRYAGEQGLSLHVSFTNEPLQSIKQEVFFPPLPNVWFPSLQVCLMNCPGTGFTQVMKDFWNTRYLDCEDWYCFPVLDKETPIRTYQRWERMTKEDPTFILDVEWTHPCRLDAIPEFDLHGTLRNGRSGKSEYGGTSTNRRDGPIRGFAVVGRQRGTYTLQLRD
jgi:hypothetical protein